MGKKSTEAEWNGKEAEALETKKNTAAFEVLRLESLEIPFLIFLWVFFVHEKRVPCKLTPLTSS